MTCVSLTYSVHNDVAALENDGGAPVGDEDQVTDIDGGRHGAAADGAHGRIRRPSHPEGGVREAGRDEGGADEAQETVAVDLRPDARLPWPNRRRGRRRRRRRLVLSFLTTQHFL